ncbi:MAG TPA: hypothetical protein VGI39_19160 [Polyangiaceae bacterium]
MMRRLASALALSAALAACNGTTGDELIRFEAYAAGVSQAGQPFTTSNGYSVQLTTAKMRIGAVYLNEAPLATGAEGPSCLNPGVYAAQVPGGIEVDLLSSQPQEFSVYGNGSIDPSLSWELWLTDGDVNGVNTAHMVDLQGVATRLADGQTFSFGAIVTINDNRIPKASDPSQPGLNPICKQRIVQIGGIDMALAGGGKLLVTVDPRRWFSLDLDFSQLPLASSSVCQLDPDSTYAYVPETPAAGTCGASGQGCCGASDPSGDFGTCDDGLACNGGVCGAQYCIPDTNYATGLGSLQGQELFSGIHNGGGAAYSVSFSK